jgi:hypothetical protein
MKHHVRMKSFGHRKEMECAVAYVSKDILSRGTDKSLARPGRKQATATEDFEFHISYL